MPPDPQPLAASAPLPQAPPLDAHAFDRGIASVALGRDRHRAHIEPHWDVFRGPNGGYLAALLLQTMTRRLGDSTRRPRVLSLHYPRVPDHGPVEIRTQLARQGRSMSWLSAELHQGGQLRVTARAAFSAEWPGIEYARLQPPTLAPLSTAVPLPVGRGMPPFTRHYDYRSTFGAPFTPSGHDAVGGYIRPRAPRPYDPALLAALSDAWYPSTFAHDARMVMGATLDLTVHFRDHEALEQLEPDAFVQTIFRSRLATQGFFEEDGELWSLDGRLLAQSRQLAIAAPLT